MFSAGDGRGEEDLHNREKGNRGKQKRKLRERVKQSQHEGIDSKKDREKGGNGERAYVEQLSKTEDK